MTLTPTNLRSTIGTVIWSHFSAADQWFIPWDIRHALPEVCGGAKPDYQAVADCLAAMLDDGFLDYDQTRGYRIRPATTNSTENT